MSVNKNYDATKLDWQLEGYYPFEWQLGKSVEIDIDLLPEVGRHGMSIEILMKL